MPALVSLLLLPIALALAEQPQAVQFCDAPTDQGEGSGMCLEWSADFEEGDAVSLLQRHALAISSVHRQAMPVMQDVNTTLPVRQDVNTTLPTKSVLLEEHRAANASILEVMPHMPFESRSSWLLLYSLLQSRLSRLQQLPGVRHVMRTNSRLRTLILPYTCMLLCPIIFALLTWILILSRPPATPHRALTITPVTVSKWILFIFITWGLQLYLHQLVLVFLAIPGHDSGLFTKIYYIQEPIRYIICLLPVSLMAFVPWPNQERNKLWENDPKFLSQIAVVVPCHKCADEIKPQIESYLRFFEPHQIALVDNANSPLPPDNLRKVIQEINPKVKYVYVPEGLKTQALHVGVSGMADFKYVLLVDDDTQLQPDMVFDESFFLEDDKLAGIGWPRDVVQHNMVTSIVNFQLKGKSGQMRQSVMYAFGGSNYFLVGVMALYKRDIWLNIMEQHPCTPYGEDVYSGSIALALGYRLATDQRNCAVTYSPPVITGMCSGFSREQGYGAATLFKQRALRWNCTGMRNMPWMCRHLWKHRSQDARTGFFFRWMVFRWFAQKFLQFLRPWLLSVLIVNRAKIFWMFPFHLLSVYLMNLAIDSCINYIFWYGQGEHQASFPTIMCSAAMDMLLGLFTLIGSVKCLTWDIWHPAYRWRVGTWKKFLHLRPEPAGDCSSQVTNGHRASDKIDKARCCNS
mmetsp:Transcript_36734/g.66013  ORF Transcript_36734/g.66013 Transcript_36734/m.66013 type:complete len:688 (-) Transcript_36734:353-2416(-)